MKQFIIDVIIKVKLDVGDLTAAAAVQNAQMQIFWICVNTDLIFCTELKCLTSSQNED